MLQRLEIWNFQRHRHLEITLEDVNCCAGRTDSGKSSILRAVRWVCTNQPSGIAFIRKGATKAKVKLFVDGHTITRIKGKGVNSYWLDGQRYAAFGNGVPEAITKILNINDLSWQMQLDSPLWMTDSPSEVSRQLNQIVNLGIMDKSLAEASKAVRRAKSEEELTEKRLASAATACTGLRWVKPLSDRLDALYAVLDALELKSKKVDRLKSLLSDLEAANRRVDTPIPDVSRADKVYEIILKTEAKAGRLGGLLDQLGRAKSLAALKKREIAEVEKELQGFPNCPLCGKNI